MRMIDPHHHLWDLNALHYPWLMSGGGEAMFGDFTPLCSSYLVEDYRADTGPQVVKSVHVQAEHDEANPVVETAWLQSVADKAKSGGFPHAIVAFADFGRDDVEETLAAHASFPSVRGIRQILTYHEDARLTHAPREYLKDPEWRRRLGLLQNYGLSFDLQLYPSQMARAAELIGANERTLFILNHTGSPVHAEIDGGAEWRNGMKLLASCPNVVVKISGLGMVQPRWTIESVRPFVAETIDMFGIERCMFASNFPVDRLFSSFRTLVDAFDRITAAMPESDRGKLFHDNAERYYRLETLE